MIIADTGAIVALVDGADRHHQTVRQAFEQLPDEWVLPWAILPEVDYLLATHVGRKAEDVFLQDLAMGAFAVEWGQDDDLDASGGDIELMAVNGNSADVRLTGMCAGCPSAHMTLHVGVETAIREEIPEFETLRLV